MYLWQVKGSDNYLLVLEANKPGCDIRLVKKIEPVFSGDQLSTDAGMIIEIVIRT